MKTKGFLRSLVKVENGKLLRTADTGRAVVEPRPRCDDPVWRAAFDRMLELMRQTPATGYRVGKVTENDKYDDAP